MFKINEDAHEALSWFSYSARSALSHVDKINDFQEAAIITSDLTEGKFDWEPCIDQETVNRLLTDLRAVEECVLMIRKVLEKQNLETEK